ncbi:PhoPQ-activated pathogenicity-related family protein [Pseudomonas viridiflava]|uniref:PhoPQ-activated pathogenicity-related family protein n=1 Tax=Pseudomonas viridiflava TaxID=33069 RepID=UPI000F06F72B|nr:PhoPQ-activated protein PqaA family protein [Pseudomonas viridiflava]
MAALRRLLISVQSLALTLFASSNVAAQPTAALTSVVGKGEPNFSEVLMSYKKSQASIPLSYKASGVESLPGIEKRTFELKSQTWSPEGLVEPAQWLHEVVIYIPDNARPGQALLIANNGTHLPRPGDAPRPADDFSEEIAISVARKTGTIVISTSNVPNQYLTYTDDGLARREDDSVAHSWKLFLRNPQQRPTMSLHIPMMQSMIKTMDLAQRELASWKVDEFIISGASKRGWATWLTAIADERVVAIVPFVIDVLGMDKVLEHTYRTYGNSWPAAFSAYQREGITRQTRTAAFDKLLQIEDPLRYLDSPYGQRLAIPKYIVNASGDDFFVPDSTRFFFNELPGPKALRVAPNSSHYGIREYLEEALVPFINRLREGRPLPTATLQSTRSPEPQRFVVSFSEPPVKVMQWTASNPLARDFRYACGIRYQPETLTVTAQKTEVTLKKPEQGWMASFVEATFSDGIVITTPVHILPQRYPVQRPPVVEPACKTLTDD